MSKTLCAGSGQEAKELRTAFESLFTQCELCGRILKPTYSRNKGWTLRQHQPKGKTTASLDRTRETLWNVGRRRHEADAELEEQEAWRQQPHVAIGMLVYVRPGSLPAGMDFDDDEYFDDDFYARRWTVRDVNRDKDGEYYEVDGWAWEPQKLTQA